MERLDFHHRASVVSNGLISTDHYHLVLRDEALARSAVPGQFVNLRIDQREDLLLRRPFSIAMTRPEASLLDIVYHVVGKGTRAMVGLRPGDVVDLMGPLGRGFHLPEKPARSLLLGGGCGVAPLWGVAAELSRSGGEMIALLGFQSSDKVFGEDLFQRYQAETVVTTDDGSYGLPGFASDHLGGILSRQINRAYVCGPVPMIKAVIPLMKKANVKAEVSLEERMGCGYGVCLSCVVNVLKDGVIEKQRVCREGPVFDLGEVVLDDET